MKKEEARKHREKQEKSLKKALEDAPTELELKRQAEQRAREENTRRIRQAKKAFKQADLHFSKGDYGLAEKHLLQVLSHDNDHLDANLKLGLLYLRQENLGRAEFFFQKLLDLKEDPVYYSNLALTLYQQSRLEEACKLYERAIEMDANKPGRFVSLAHVYQEMNEMERALELIEEAARLEPRNIDHLWSLLGFYEKFSQHKDCHRTLVRILEIEPYNEQARAKLTILEG